MPFHCSCTLQSFPNHGNYRNGAGLEGALKRGVISCQISMSKHTELFFPLNQDINFALAPVLYGHEPNVTYTNPIYEETMALASLYHYNDDDVKDADLFDTYLNFHWSYYFSVTVSFFIFVLSWYLFSRIGKKISKKVRHEIRNARKPG